MAGDFFFQVVALVQHEVHTGVFVQRSHGDDFVHDAEKLERIGGTDHEVVVRVEAGVEIKGPEPSDAQELGNNELDVGAWGVVSGVQNHHGVGAKCLAVHQRGTPVGNIGVVKRGLEELVFQDDALALAEVGIDLLEGVGEAVLAGADGILPGVVGAVGQPDFQVGGPRLVHDVNALAVVVNGLGADALVAVAEGAELVVVVLEDVGVDRPDGYAMVGGVCG